MPGVHEQIIARVDDGIGTRPIGSTYKHTNAEREREKERGLKIRFSGRRVLEVPKMI